MKLEFPNKIINLSSILILSIINILFITKYLTRAANSPLLPLIIGIAYCIIIFILLLKITGIKSTDSNVINYKSYISISIIITVVLLFIVGLAPATSRVARLPAIKEWLSNFLAGRFPYIAKANPSGFPVLFLIALPFYLLHNVGYLEALGYLLFAGTVLIYSKNNKEILLRNAIILLMPPFYYEVFVRSELFFNISLTLFIVLTTSKYLQQKNTNFSFIVTAVVYGLLLSTRLIVGIILAVFIIYF